MLSRVALSLDNVFQRSLFFLHFSTFAVPIPVSEPIVAQTVGLTFEQQKELLALQFEEEQLCRLMDREEKLEVEKLQQAEKLELEKMQIQACSSIKLKLEQFKLQLIREGKCLSVF